MAGAETPAAPMDRDEHRGIGAEPPGATKAPGGRDRPARDQPAGIQKGHRQSDALNCSKNCFLVYTRAEGGLPYQTEARIYASDKNLAATVGPIVFPTIGSLPSIWVYSPTPSHAAAGLSHENRWSRIRKYFSLKCFPSTYTVRQLAEKLHLGVSTYTRPAIYQSAARFTLIGTLLLAGKAILARRAMFAVSSSRWRRPIWERSGWYACRFQTSTRPAMCIWATA